MDVIAAFKTQTISWSKSRPQRLVTMSRQRLRCQVGCMYMCGSICDGRSHFFSYEAVTKFFLRSPSRRCFVSRVGASRPGLLYLFFFGGTLIVQETSKSVLGVQARRHLRHADACDTEDRRHTHRVDHAKVRRGLLRGRPRCIQPSQQGAVK